MSDNIGGIFLTLLTWMMGILLGLNALWFGWQVNQVNDYNTQVGQMISKEGGYDRVSGWNAAELSAQSYHNHFALYSWVPYNKYVDNRPVKEFEYSDRYTESVTQAHGDQIRYRIKAQIPLIAFVPKFKWTHTFDETVVSTAGNYSPNHAGLRYELSTRSPDESYAAYSKTQSKVANEKLRNVSTYKQSFGTDWAIHYADDAYDVGFLIIKPWADSSLTLTQKRTVANVFATLAAGTRGSQDMRDWPYLTVKTLYVPTNYLSGYSHSNDKLLEGDSHQFDNAFGKFIRGTGGQMSHIKRFYSEQFKDWAKQTVRQASDYDATVDVDHQPTDQQFFAAPGKVSLWLTKDWNEDGVYRARVHQLTGWGSKHPAGEVTQATKQKAKNPAGEVTQANKQKGRRY